MTDQLKINLEQDCMNLLKKLTIKSHEDACIIFGGAIRSFINHLWHYPDESFIDSKRPIIAFLKNGDVMKLRYMTHENIFRNNNACVERNDIIKFFYMEDLI